MLAGDQLINNEVKVYGSHFGGNLKTAYPGLYTSTLPRGRRRDWKKKVNDGVRLQNLQSISGFKFLSISKNRYFAKGNMKCFLHSCYVNHDLNPFFLSLSSCHYWASENIVHIFIFPNSHNILSLLDCHLNMLLLHLLSWNLIIWFFCHLI